MPAQFHLSTLFEDPLFVIFHLKRTKDRKQPKRIGSTIEHRLYVGFSILYTFYLFF